jgi:hypothetical protein
MQDSFGIEAKTMDMVILIETDTILRINSSNNLSYQVKAQSYDFNSNIIY